MFLNKQNDHLKLFKLIMREKIKISVHVILEYIV